MCFIDDESLKIAAEEWFESQKKKNLFSRHKELRRKVEKCTDVAGE